MIGMYVALKIRTEDNVSIPIIVEWIAAVMGMATFFLPQEIVWARS